MPERPTIFYTVFAVDGENQTITLRSGGKIRARSKTYFKARFEFTLPQSGTNAFLKLDHLSATFSPVPFERSRAGAYIVPLEEDSGNYECEIPWEVLTRKGKVHVGVFAGDMLVTNEAEIEVTQAAPTLGYDSQPTQSWWSRFSTALAVAVEGLVTRINGKQDILTFDSAPTANSSNPVTSGGVYNATGNTLKYTAQTLTDTQKAQARTNIGAYSSADAETATSALAGRISDIESKEGGWDAKYDAFTPGGIPIDSLSAETQIEIFAGRQAYDALGGKQDRLTAGDNITIENNVISASGGGAGIEPYTDNPSMDGQASAGSSAKYARGDHVHPSDSSKYSFPSGGIPETDLASTVQTSLGKADTAYQKPNGGIPASDLASGVIPTVPDELADLSDDATHRLVTDTEKAAWTAKASVPKYTTLTLATSDWETSGNDYVCSKTVTGMTATSIVWLAYSDTETEFTEAQSANALTFTVGSLPSAAITVNVAFMEGSAT